MKPLLAVLFGAVLSAGCAGVQAEALTATLLAAGARCGGTSPAPAARWIQDREALEGLSLDAVPAVDLERQRLLLLEMGQQRSGGYRLRLADPGVEVGDGTARLRVEWLMPEPGMMTAQVITSPCLLVALPRGGYRRVEVVDQAGRSRFSLPVP